MKEKGLRSKIEEYFKIIEEMDGITGKELKRRTKAFITPPYRVFMINVPDEGIFHPIFPDRKDENSCDIYI